MTKIGDCTKDTCPVSESYLGYDPSKGANVAFAIIFALSFLIYLFQCFRARMWSFFLFMGIGVALECVGYVGRIKLASDPFSGTGFKIQIICLTFAPAFMAGSIYLTLKHIVNSFSAEISRIKPKWYTWIFVFCDVFSILLQAIGAIVAAVAADDNPKNLKKGNNIMIAGLAFQIFTLTIFGLLALEYGIRAKRYSNKLNPATLSVRQSRQFKTFLVAFVVAYLAMQIRCIYRLVEMAGGWGNSLMQNETLFIILDSCMCALIALILNLRFPAFLFNLSKNLLNKRVSPQNTDLEDLSQTQERIYNGRK